MFKLLLIFLCTGYQISVFAGDVKVTSFRFLENGTHYSPAAEFCGELVMPTGKVEMIKITSDPELKVPAIYYVWAGKEGKFCSVIATFTGKASADLN